MDQQLKQWKCGGTLAVNQLRLCILQRSIWRPITSQCRAKAVAIQRLLQTQPANTVLHFPVFGGCFMASHIPRFFACPKNKKERDKMATLRGVDRHFRGPGQQKSWRKGKTPGDATRKWDTATVKQHMWALNHFLLTLTSLNASGSCCPT